MSAHDVTTTPTIDEEQARTTARNAAVVRRAYQAFNEADGETLMELFDERASWHTPGRSPVAGERTNRDATFEQFGRYGSTDHFTADLKRVLTDEDGRVIGVHHNRAERNGKRLDVYCCIEFELDDGRIVSGREHFYDLYAWDEFWS